MYIYTIHHFKFFWKLVLFMLVIVKYALISFWSEASYSVDNQRWPPFNRDQHQDNQHKNKLAKQALGSANKGIWGISIKLYQLLCLMVYSYLNLNWNAICKKNKSAWCKIKTYNISLILSILSIYF